MFQQFVDLGLMVGFVIFLHMYIEFMFTNNIIVIYIRRRVASSFSLILSYSFNKRNCNILLTGEVH